MTEIVSRPCRSNPTTRGKLTMAVPSLSDESGGETGVNWFGARSSVRPCTIPGPGAINQSRNC